MMARGRVEAKTWWTINGRFTSQRLTGVQRYAREIVNGLDQLLNDRDQASERIHFNLAMPSDASDKPVLSQIESWQSRRGSGHFWEQCVLPFYQRSGVLCLGNLGPIAVRNAIVCIHDANTFVDPESYSTGFRGTYRILQPIIGRRARRVATVSQYSAEMLAKYRICRSEQIFIAPNGYEHAMKWEPARATLPLLGALGKPYVLLLGSRAKHKNIQVILRVAEQLEVAGIDIVIVGSASQIFADISQRPEQPNVHQTGYVTDHDLAALYEGALCLTFPSTTEGFGIPPLEAMARGCPVISSTAPSLREVGGNAVCYVDPNRPDDWKDAIIGLFGNQELRNDLIEKGRRRAELFSWRRSAQIYLDEILKIADD